MQKYGTTIIDIANSVKFCLLRIDFIKLGTTNNT